MTHSTAKETLNRNPEEQWPPNAGIIVGKIVEAMNLRVGALSERTSRRYFRGERIKESEQNDIFFELSYILFESGMAAMPNALPESYPLDGYFSGGLVANCRISLSLLKTNQWWRREA